jgi:hypothetical protein
MYREPSVDKLVQAAERRSYDPGLAGRVGGNPKRAALSILTPLAHAGLPASQALRFLESPHRPGLYLVQARLESLDAMGRRLWLDEVWDAACKRVEPWSSDQARKIATALRVAALVPVEGAEGRSDRSTLIAILLEVQRCEALEVPFSKYSGASATGLTATTVRRSIRRLEATKGLINVNRQRGRPPRVRVRPGRILALAPVGSRSRDMAQDLPHPVTLVASQAGDAMDPQDLTTLLRQLEAKANERQAADRQSIQEWLLRNPFHDAFHADAARPLGHHLLCLLAHSDLSTAELVDLSGASAAMVRRCLNVLARAQIVRSPSHGRWMMTHDPRQLNDGLHEIATTFETLGSAKQREALRAQQVAERTVAVRAYAHGKEIERITTAATQLVVSQPLPWQSPPDCWEGVARELPLRVLRALLTTLRTSQVRRWQIVELHSVVDRVVFALRWPPGCSPWVDWVRSEARLALSEHIDRTRRTPRT